MQSEQPNTPDRAEGWYGVGTTKSSSFLEAVIPGFSIMSKSSPLPPSGSFQSKLYRSQATGSSTLAKPNVIPGHILLPLPKGRYSKSPPTKSGPPSSNLSGTKLSGSFQNSGSLCMAHVLTITLTLAGIVYPPTTRSSLDALGRIGTGGCSLMDSLITSFSSPLSITLNNTSTKSSFPNSPFPFLISPTSLFRFSSCSRMISSRIVSILRLISTSLLLLQLSALTTLESGYRSATTNPSASLSPDLRSPTSPSLSLHTFPNAARQVMELIRENTFSVRLTGFPAEARMEWSTRAISSARIEAKERTFLALRSSRMQILRIWRQ
ncbi:peptidase C78 [Striga asiatica]|uniref:Peptidase C78 n=1 Tax=Striga asiatica TaxID=4170 RepID=A0A5A7PU64_STRAF|nr:peptidase C78 [Striga asiatica]